MCKDGAGPLHILDADESMAAVGFRQVEPATYIALIYNGLGDRNETLTWLERGIEQRDPRMTFLNAQLRWSNVRDDSRFQDVLRRVGVAI